MLNQFVRYEPVLRLVRELGAGTLLDAGSGSVGARPWLGPEWRITAVDSDFADYGTATGPAADGATRLVGDVRALDFDDGSFDIVLALDLLEHLQPADRPAALSELARVTRRRLIVACPAGAAALDADRRLAAAYAARDEPVPGWLAEHLATGFPDPRELQEALAAGGRLRLLRNENVRSHLLLMRAEAGPRSRWLAMAAGKLVRPAVAGGAAAGPASLLMRLVRGLDRAPSYRTIAVLDRQ
jgi:SAM-dependent methyltransferase